MDVTIEYLEDERKKIWADIVEKTRTIEILSTNILDLQKQVQDVRIIAEAKTVEDQSTIRGILNKTSEYKNKIQESYNAVEEILQQIHEKTEQIDAITKNISAISLQVKENEKAINDKTGEINVIYKTITEINQNYDDILEKYDKYIAESEEKIAEINSIESEISKTNDSITEIYKNIQNFKTKSAERRNEIKELYDEIFGSQDENGEQTEGLKDELTNCYKDLKQGLQTLQEDFIKLKNDKEKEYLDFKNTKEKEFNEIKNKIQSLLPGSMSVGLSYAYNQKRRREEKSKKHFELTFNIAIIVLICIATIPAGIAAILLFKLKYTIIAVIGYLPQLLGLITPFYLPVIWIALSASKKANQSKRLIEEYAHKESISKTYEGLSKEVNKLDDEEELKEKLLSNIISTSAENPGKLLQGFNKPDYPMLEIIDKFTKLIKSAKTTDEIQAIIDGIVNISKNVSSFDKTLSQNAFYSQSKNEIKNNEDEDENEE